MSVRIIRQESVTLNDRGGPPGTAFVGRAIDGSISSTMGAGFGRFDGSAIEWTLLYDEVIYVISGTFTVEVDGEVHAAEAGDVMWIPAGTSVIYGGQAAHIFYAVQPGNWAELQRTTPA
ncbi:cupin domain-containing protein [Novosphingobium sp. BL-8H]|uniref:cupin domain-containing protein n=1 Tax=Novosphingobium sp. BL-8H TaxID=3127640 RepID=UPI00375660F2